MKTKLGTLAIVFGLAVTAFPSSATGQNISPQASEMRANLELACKDEVHWRCFANLTAQIAGLYTHTVQKLPSTHPELIDPLNNACLDPNVLSYLYNDELSGGVNEFYKEAASVNMKSCIESLKSTSDKIQEKTGGRPFVPDVLEAIDHYRKCVFLVMVSGSDYKLPVSCTIKYRHA